MEVEIDGKMWKTKMELDMRYLNVVEEIENEYLMARERFPRFASGHEALAVLMEEFEELKVEVFKRNPRPERLREEAIQVAAMGLRFVMEVCERTEMGDLPEIPPAVEEHEGYAGRNEKGEQS